MWGNSGEWLLAEGAALQEVTWRVSEGVSGEVDVLISWPPYKNSAKAVPLEVYHVGGARRVVADAVWYRPVKK